MEQTLQSMFHDIYHIVLLSPDILYDFLCNSVQVYVLLGLIIHHVILITIHIVLGP